jgi:hypothetical protein
MSRYRSISIATLVVGLLAGAVYFSRASYSQGTIPSRVVARDNTPVFGINSDRPVKHVDLFVSPTCNQCNILFVNVINAIQHNDSHFAGADVTFALTPTSEDDYQIILGLMCVPTAAFPSVVTKYYLDLYAPYAGQVIAPDYAKSEAWQLAQKKGITAAQYTNCLGNAARRRTIANVFVIADKLRPKHEVPFVIYNDQPTGIQSFSELQGILNR